MEPNIFRYIWKHSRREQLMILALILCSLPFYWLSLEVPKRIVNQSLQGKAFSQGNTTVRLFDYKLDLPDFLGGQSFVVFEGIEFDRLGHLLALSFLFLFFVVCNGGFKLAINLSKGLLAERMLRRMRFELFARLMRFQPEEIRTVKPAEAASMINNEIEPVGAFIGDAFIQPMFLGTQALTALIFILTQSFWLGMVALAIVLVQAIVIPYLRREQVRLGRERQIASRRLAGRIGEMVDGASLIHTHGLQRYGLADIGGRLGLLFDIRANLYKRKFAVKFLNNFLAQITPFFFFVVGGYLALRGQLDIGQLVAVIAAYRDLPPPIKELIDWDQARADATVKYEQVVLQLSGQGLIRDDDDAAEPIVGTPIITLDAVRVDDYRGAPLLNEFTASIPGGAHVALIGASSSGRDIVARVVARQLTKFEGRVRFNDVDLRTMSDAVASSVLSYAPPEPILIAGTIRDNVAIALCRRPPEPGPLSELRWREACRTGNSRLARDADWHDYEAAGIEVAADLDKRIVASLGVVGMTSDLYTFGLQGRIPADADEALCERIVAARHAIQAELVKRKLASLVEVFDFERFNRQKTLAENLVFGVVASPRLSGQGLAGDAFFRRIIAAEGLEYRLTEIGLKIAENSVEVFAGLPSDHPLLERFSMIKATELDEYATIIATARRKDASIRLRQEERDRLISLALAYVEPRHRLGLVDASLMDRILRARESFRRYLPQDYAQEIEFYEAGQIVRGAPMRDNLLFGRVSQNIANAEQRVSEFLHEMLSVLGLEDFIYEMGLDFDVGPAGRNLFAQQRAAINVARNVLAVPRVLVIEGALAPFGDDAAAQIMQRLQALMSGRTLLATFSDAAQAKGFDMLIEFEGGRGRIRSEPGSAGEARVAVAATDEPGDMPGERSEQRVEAKG